MMLVEPVTLTDPVAVEAALLSPLLVPPPNTLTPGATAEVSLLWQTFDATAALFASTLLANQTGTRRRPAVAATARTATEAVTIGSIHIEPGAAVVIDLELSRFEFGLGLHVAAVLGREDGRPKKLSLRPLAIHRHSR